MKTLIALNGTTSISTTAFEEIKDADLIIGVDGGTLHLERLGLVPTLLIGDLDSIDKQRVTTYEQKGVEIRKFPVHKDKTDFELALELACDRGTRQLSLIGGLGGRWDMSLSNLFVVAQAKYKEMDITFWDDGVCLRVHQPRKKYWLQRSDGQLISLLPLVGDITGITIDGFQYPLNNETLPYGASRGLSNVLLSELGYVNHESGVLLVVQQKDRGTDENQETL